jgi:hypothetical protein
MTHVSAASSWVFPPEGRPEIPGIPRTNLRELAARPGRWEHHLTVVARSAGTQLEIATASEPLYFGHVNVSDELALALPTGDAMIDAFPLRTFVSDHATAEDVARYNHRVLDLVLHPLGPLHWPGRLRPPFEPFVFPKGMRRCALSLVFCASTPTDAPPGGQPRGVTAGRDADAKAYTSAASRLGLCELGREAPGKVAVVGDASLELLVAPGEIRPRRGAYVVVLACDGAGPHHPCDLLYVAPGAGLDGKGIARALVLESESHDAEPPPPAWATVPGAEIVPIESGPRGALPFEGAGLRVTALDAAFVEVRIGASSARVPRHWLARMLFRVLLHPPVLGYVETYGGFFYDDRTIGRGETKLGLRGGESVTLTDPTVARALVDRIYRAVAPETYVERCDE